jgi:hypothetical protein
MTFSLSNQLVIASVSEAIQACAAGWIATALARLAMTWQIGPVRVPATVRRGGQ